MAQPCSLDVEDLHADAVATTGLDDFGRDPTYRAGLEVMTRAALEEERGAPYEQAVHDRMVHLLSTRLQFVQHAKDHPDVLDGRIERPVILVGLPRTGTTILFDLLALDPASRAPIEWEVQLPWPPPEAATFADDPRRALVQAGLDAACAAEPTIPIMHPTGAHLPGECNTIMEYHFAGPDFWAGFGPTAYTEWVATTRVPGVYDTHHRFLQHLQWHGPRGRWTLKSPGHLLDLEGLLAVYPDACLVWTHRDPSFVMGSLSSLITPIRRLSGGDDDPLRLGASTELLWGATLERGTASRDDERVERAILDVPFRDVVGDPVGLVERIHDHFGLPFDPGHRQRMEHHLASQPHASGGHQYSLEHFGHHPDEIAKRFSSYYERFGDLI